MVGIIESNETLTPTELADGLYTLQDMIDGWSLDNFMVNQHVNATYNLTAGLATYTLGVGGTMNGPRPSAIRSGYTTLNGVDFPLLSIGDAEYNAITFKTSQSSYPQVVHIDGGYPFQNVTFWPAPVGNMTATFSVEVDLAQPVTLATSMSFAPGYLKAMRYNLAIELAAEFSVPVPDAVRQIAVDTIANLKIINLPDDVLEFDPAWSNGFGGLPFGGKVL